MTTLSKRAGGREKSGDCIFFWVKFFFFFFLWCSFGGLLIFPQELNHAKTPRKTSSPCSGKESVTGKTKKKSDMVMGQTATVPKANV